MTDSENLIKNSIVIILKIPFGDRNYITFKYGQLNGLYLKTGLLFITLPLPNKSVNAITANVLKLLDCISTTFSIYIYIQKKEKKSNYLH